MFILVAISSLLALLIISSPFVFTESFGHRDGCHRWHSCPSDNGSYVCGDLGHDSECGSSSNRDSDESSDNKNNKQQSDNSKNNNNDNTSIEETTSNKDNNNPFKSDYSQAAQSNEDACSGTAHCFTGTVTKVVDGDTLDVDKTRIRLALVNTPEINQQGYTEAKEYVINTCGVGSNALVDEDDGQKQGSYGRMIGLVYCNDSAVSLNQLLLESGHATILENICKRSEFANQQWAQSNGC